MTQNLKTKLYQMFITGLGEKTELALKAGLGGVIFFTKDIISKQQFKELTTKIKKESLISPFLSIDQEGGRVERTENIHNGKKYLSAKYAFEKGEDFLEKQTEQIAKELKDYGINLNFAPCIDVNTNVQNPIINERAFSSNVEDVIKGEKIVSSTYRKNGIIPCVKHYPGHGDAQKDSHLTLPEINLTLEEMEKIHIRPFKTAIENNAEMVMAAHLDCECFGKGIPTSLNKKALDYLRNNLNFRGIIISDDMAMKGVAKYSPAQACIMGISAGINMFIYRNCTEQTIDMIEQILKQAENDPELENKIKESYEKIIQLKNKYLK